MKKMALQIFNLVITGFAFAVGGLTFFKIYNFLQTQGVVLDGLTGFGWGLLIFAATMITGISSPLILLVVIAYLGKFMGFSKK